MSDQARIAFTFTGLNATGTTTQNPDTSFTNDNVAAIFQGKAWTDIFGQVNTSAVPGGTPTADVYLQTSVDGGTTWRDVAHAAQITTSTGSTFFQVSGKSAGGTAFLAASDAALAANTVVQGPFGELLRVKVVVGGTLSSASYSIKVSLVLK